jgi:CheY-like chemotaxis protein
MYFIFVSNDIEAVRNFEEVLHAADAKKILVTVSNGYDLIDYLQNVKRGQPYPDLIIITQKFLRITGIDLLELLKTDDMYRLIPVLMMLLEDNDEQHALCNRLGSEYMAVPKDRREWVSAVDRMCTVYS